MDQVDQIKRQLNVVDIVGSYIELKKAGNNYKALCPFHSEKSPSFMVSPELQIFKCFGCGEAGDIFSFIQKIEGVEFPQALEQLADKAGIKLEKAKGDPEKSRKAVLFEINHLAAQYYHYILTKHRVGKKALAYFTKKRGLTMDTILSFNLGYAPDSWDSLFGFLTKKKYSINDMLAAGIIVQSKSGTHIDKFKGRVIFPMMGIDGNVVGFAGRTLFDRDPKYLNTSETLVFHKGSFLFGLDRAKVSVKKEGAVFVEGPVDVISACQAGITNVIATSGTALTTAQLKIIARYTQDITFCFDSDTAGFAAMERAIGLTERENLNVRVALLPDGFKDLDEFLVAKDGHDVKKVLSQAAPVYDFFIADALKKNNKHDPIGKKKIVAELIPWFAKINDPVTQNHYGKKLAELVGIDEEVITTMLKTGSAADDGAEFSADTSAQNAPSAKITSPQEYLLVLLLRAPLDAAQKVLYKLGQRDFTNPQFEAIFPGLKAYLLGRKKKFEIKHFSNKFDETLRKVVEEMYLWDLGESSNGDAFFDSEIDMAFARVKQDTVKRELKELGAKIKEAELENNQAAIKELSEKFEELSQKLI